MKRYVKSTTETLDEVTPKENKMGLRFYSTYDKTNGNYGTCLIVDTKGHRFQIIDGNYVTTSDLYQGKDVSSVKKIKEMADMLRDSGYEEFIGYGSLAL